jgi:L-arabinokinase
MYRLVDGDPGGLRDVERFLETVRTLPANPSPEARSLFVPGPPIIVTRAPGRLDVMGGIADYSGSLVLQLPTRVATLAAAQRAPDRQIRVVSLDAAALGLGAALAVDLDELAPRGRPVSYDQARALFRRDTRTSWAAYAAGALLVLGRERGLSLAEGARVLVSSDLPAGKGVASSAALEVAAMTALARAFGVPLEPRETALLCQKVENLVVGAPCGVMDQMTAVCGEPDRLLALLCQPAELKDPITVPEDIAFFGVDSNVRHAVSGADYTSVRVGAFMGYRILAEAAGLPVRRAATGEPVTVEDPLWGGYLANLEPSLFEERFSPVLPSRMRGAAFLECYGGTTDPVTRVEPEREYAVRAPAAHPVHESFRVRTFASLLAAPASEARRRLLGELMYQSHLAYGACGLGSAGTDRIVQLAREAGLARGIYGAKITGGGSGGVVAVLAREDAGDAVSRIAERYAAETGRPAAVFSGSSPGAAAFAGLTLAPA